MSLFILLSLITAVSASSCGVQSDTMVMTNGECGGSYGSASWPDCCSTDAECRDFDFTPPVSGGQCGGGNVDETMEFNITFWPETDESCCTTCSCYGDPECFSFDHTFKKWIICDGRPDDSCKIHKNKCLSLTDHNDNKCVWKNGRKKDIQGI